MPSLSQSTQTFLSIPMVYEVDFTRNEQQQQIEEKPGCHVAEST